MATVLKRFLLFDGDNNPGVSWEPYAEETVPGVIKTDGQTFTKNAETNQYSVTGEVTKDGTLKYDWIGTLTEYKAAKEAGTIQRNWMCFLKDTNFVTAFGLSERYLSTRNLMEIVYSSVEQDDDALYRANGQTIPLEGFYTALGLKIKKTYYSARNLKAL